MLILFLLIPFPQGAGGGYITRDIGEEETSDIKKGMSDNCGSGSWVLLFASGICPTTVGQVVSARGTALEASLQANSPSPSVGVAGPAPCQDKCPFVPALSILRKMTNLLCV